MLITRMGLSLKWTAGSLILDPFQAEAWNDPVVGKTKGEVRVVKKGHHRAFFPNRISVSFSRRDSTFIAASRFNARLRLNSNSW